MQETQTMESSGKKVSRDQRFVETVISCCDSDKGMAARLRRADNPATEYQCWELFYWAGSVSILRRVMSVCLM